MTQNGNSFYKEKIDGKTLIELTDLDRNKTSLKDRLEEVNEKLDSSTFFEDYYDNHYKVNINSNDSLSEDNHVSKALEKMANYLLLSDESKQMDKEERNNIVIHKDRKKFLNKINRESYATIKDGDMINLTEDENIMHYLVNRDRNFVKQKKQGIHASDINEDSETGKVLRDYNNFLMKIDEKLSEKPNSKWLLYSRAKSQVKDDMRLVKDMLNGVFGYNVQSQNTIMTPDYDIFDFTDRATIMSLIAMDEPSFEFDPDLWLVWLEFNQTSTKADFTDEERFVFYLLRKKWTNREIGEYLNIDSERIRRTVTGNICKKIEKVGDKYDAKDLKVKYKILNMKLSDDDEFKLFN